MIRDTFFSMHRFIGICRKEMIENWRTYMLRSVMIYGVMTIAFIWRGYFEYESMNMNAKPDVDPMWSFQMMVFLWGLLIWGCISASFTMERMKTKTSRMVVLMTPATMFEKYFSRWLVATCGFIAVFIIAFKLADWTRVLVYMLSFPNVDAISPFPVLQFCCNSGPFYEASVGNDQVLLFVSSYFAIQSFFLLGSVIWPKGALIKTFASGIVIILVYAMTSVLLNKMLIPDNFYMGKFDIEIDIIHNIIICGNFCFVLFNWILGYFRFKESEIINRW